MNWAKLMRLTVSIILLGLAQGDSWIITPGENISIQGMIDLARPGDIVHVEGGTYYENINVDKPLTLRGVEMPVVDGGGNGSSITLSADGIVLEGFVATNPSKSPEEAAGIKVSSDYNIIKNNSVYNNSIGIILNNSDNNSIEANNFSNNGFGIYLLGSHGNKIAGNNATKNGEGIRLRDSRNNTIAGNNASFNADYGVVLKESTNNTLKRNQMSGNGNNFDAGGENDIDTSNRVDGKAIYYLVGAINMTIDSSLDAAGIVYCLNCVNITIKDQNFENNSLGVFFHNTTNSSIEKNVLKNENGIIFHRSNNNTITGNNFSNGSDAIILLEAYRNTIADNIVIDNHKNGFLLQESRHNTITGNSINNDGSHNGIHLDRSSNNMIRDNNIRDGNDGISLLRADWNTIMDNLVSNSKKNGILLDRSHNNTLIENNASYNRGLRLSCNWRSVKDFTSTFSI